MLMLAELLFFIAALAVLIFFIVIGERFKLHVQRGWYFIVAAFSLLFLGASIEFFDSFEQTELGLILNQPMIQIGLKHFAGYAMSLIVLLGGSLVWAPTILAFREKYLLQIKESERYYRLITENASDMLAEHDLEGTFNFVTPASKSLVGYDPDELVGRSIYEFIDPDELEFIQEEHSRIMDSNTPISVTYKFKHQAGHFVWLESSTRMYSFPDDPVPRILSISRDVTEEKKAADDLANAHLQLQNVFSSATQVSIIATDLEGKITIFNPGAERMLGYTSEEMIGKGPDIFHVPAEVEARGEELSQELGQTIQGFDTYVALARLGGYTEREWTYIRKDGSRLLVESAVTATYDTSGQITGYLGIALDITQRKRGEDALRLAKSVAEDANQTKSEFLTNMSHELRTPLNSVIGFSNIILRNPKSTLDEKEISYLERIQANGTHLLSLINDILDLSKVEAGSMELDVVTINVADLVMTLIGHVESQVANKPVRLETEIPETVAEMDTDPGKLRQVLLNLLSNAIKFTEEGTITVRIHTDENTNRPAAIEVTDSGIGIPAERIDHIFDEFAQVDSSTQRKYGGTGLGLSISNALCDLMGYTLRVTSEEGTGSTFTIDIPDQTTYPMDGETIRPTMRTTPRKTVRDRIDDFSGQRILLVDDDPDSLVLLSHYLKDTHCHLEWANSTTEAMELIRRNKPDLITLDLRMPTETGDKFLASLQAEPDYASIPVVVVSVVARESRGKLPGATDFVQKPVSQHEFIWAIRRNLNQGPCCVLLVEDDDNMREMITEYLSDLHLQLRTAVNGVDALTLMENFTPDLILLDLRMPEMNGMTFLKSLKEQPPTNMPQVVIITGETISLQDELSIKHDGMVIIRKDEDFEHELRHHMLSMFSEKLE